MNSFNNTSIVLFIKWVPLLVIKTRGNTNLVIIFSYMNLEAIYFVHASTDLDSTVFIKYSTPVIIYLNPILRLGLENGPMKSFSKISKGRFRLTDVNGISYCLRSCWNLLHRFIVARHSLFRVGHHIPSCSIFLAIVSAWKWSPIGPKYASSITACLSCSSKWSLVWPVCASSILT